MGTLVFQATLGGAVNIIGPNIANTINFTLPSADGTSGQTWTTNGSGVLAFGTLGIAGGGTGQITATAAFNALAPSQSGQSGKYLTTDGTNTSWGTNPLGTVTSVAATVPSFLSISGSPITTSGTLAFTLSGTALPTTSGGTGLTSFTSGGVVYASSTSALATGSALTYNGSTFKVAGTDAAIIAGFSGTTKGVRIETTSTGTSIGGVDSALVNSFEPLDINGSYTTYSTSGTERMRLTSTGLGIGTSSPASRLTVSGDIQIVGGAATIKNSSGFLQVGTTSNDRLELITNGTLKATLSADGNLGLGVTPSAWFGVDKALQVGGTFDGTTRAGALTSQTNDAVTTLWNNAYRNASVVETYFATGAASKYKMNQNAHEWHVAASGTAGNAISFTQAMTLDATSALLINATSNDNAANRLYIQGYQGYASSATDLATSATKASARIRGSNDSSMSTFMGALTNGSAQYLQVANFSGTSSYDFAINPYGGNLLVGTTSGSTHQIDKSIENDYALNIRNTASANNYGITSRFPNASPNGAGNQFLICSDSSATRMLIYSNGGIANYQANNVNLSDRREKTNFAPATSYLDKICAIPVQTFNYIDQNLETDDGLTLGVVAQDVQAVAPELVTESNWGTEEAPKMRLSIYQTDLQYALMKCIQEQQTIITQLTARITALESA